MGKAQQAFFDIVSETGIEVMQVTFRWLSNRLEFSNEGVEDRLWQLFVRLGGSPDGMKSKARKLICPDGFLPATNCLLEFDEVQHFTPKRLITLEALGRDDPIGFDLEHYRELWRELPRSMSVLSVKRPRR